MRRSWKIGKRDDWEARNHEETEGMHRGRTKEYGHQRRWAEKQRSMAERGRKAGGGEERKDADSQKDRRARNAGRARKRE